MQRTVIRRAQRRRCGKIQLPQILQLLDLAVIEELDRIGMPAFDPVLKNRSIPLCRKLLITLYSV